LLSLESLRSFMNITIKYEVTLIINDVLQITINDENNVNLQDLHQKQMHKCSEHVDFINLKCVLIFIKIIIVWYLIKKNEWMILTLHNFWKRVALNIQQKYSTNKKNVNINLKLIFDHNKINITSSTFVAELSAMKISFTQTVKLKKKVNEHDWLCANIVKQMKVLQCYEHVWIDQSSDLILINLIKASHDAMSSLNLAHFFESSSALLLVVQHFLHSFLSSFF